MTYPSNSKTKRNLITRLRNAVYALIAIAVFSLIYVFQIEPLWFEIVSVNLTISNLAPAFDGFKIVQISDLHADTSMNPKKLGKIVNLINQQQPDIVAMTGDFITATLDRQTTLMLEAAFKKLSPTAKTLAVLGNHDHYIDPQQIRTLLHNSNVLELNNSAYTLQRGNDTLSIAGVDDFWQEKANLDLVLSQLPPQGAAILLVHEPDFADISAATQRFALQISGHSHGGQVRIPLRKPPVLPPFAEKYPVGRYKVGKMVQYTNRGVGMVLPAVRFNCRPEITVFTLNSEAKINKT